MFQKIMSNVLLAEDWSFGKQLASALIVFLIMGAVFVLYQKKGLVISMVVSVIKPIFGSQ